MATKARTANSWVPAGTAEKRNRRAIRAYIGKALQAPACRCEKPVYHKDLEDDGVCIYCGRAR